MNSLRDDYPNALLVEYYAPAKPAGNGMDWRSLWLVWQRKDATWYLVGIANDETTKRRCERITQGNQDENFNFSATLPLRRVAIRADISSHVRAQRADAISNRDARRGGA